MIVPITLEGKHIRLEPLAHHHAEALLQASLHGDLWQTPWTIVPGPTLEIAEKYIERALGLRERGEEFPFAQIDVASNTVIGSTRFMNIALPHKRLEIGGTWIGKPWQRGKWNTEAKLLLLTHAFQELGCNRVEFKTDVNNTQSRINIERIGAKYEGVFRQHIIMPNGRLRDTAYYSMVKNEWQEAKHRLTEKLNDDYYREKGVNTVIRGTMHHIDRLAELFDAYRQFYEQPSDVAGAKAFLTERLHRQESVIFAALDSNGEIQGFTQLYPTFTSVGMRRAWLLNDLYVAEKARKQGLAEALLYKAREYAISTGAKYLMLETAVTNASAQRLYERLGWVADKEHYYYYWSLPAE
jgi:RimJ/RimL family protein N-acetyltransferase